MAGKGIAVYQAMNKLSNGRPFPPFLVDEVVALSMDVPKIIEQLDWWAEAHAWCKCLAEAKRASLSLLASTLQVQMNSQKAGSSEGGLQALPQGHSNSEEVGAEDLQEPRATSPSQQDQHDA